MIKKTVFEVYIELLAGEDFTAATETSKTTAFATAQSYLKNGFVNEDSDKKRMVFIPVHEIKRIIIQEREVDVNVGK